MLQNTKGLLKLNILVLRGILEPVGPRPNTFLVLSDDAILLLQLLLSLITVHQQNIQRSALILPLVHSITLLFL